MSLKWMKWRHTFAHGSDEAWEWMEIEERCVHDEIVELGREYDWSDKYRGVEYTLHAAPDPVWLKEHIEELDAIVVNTTRRKEHLQFLLDCLQPSEADLERAIAGVCGAEFTAAVSITSSPWGDIALIESRPETFELQKALNAEGWEDLPKQVTRLLEDGQRGVRFPHTEALMAIAVVAWKSNDPQALKYLKGLAQMTDQPELYDAARVASLLLEKKTND